MSDFIREKRKKLLLRHKLLYKLMGPYLLKYGLENYSKRLIQRIKKGELISKILKEKYFWKHKFYTSNNTLDPREDTEVMVDIFLQHYEKNYMNTNMKYNVLDCCCGTGAIGISLNLEINNLRVTYVDISHQALQICKKNIRLHKIWHKSKIYKTSLEKIETNTIYDFLVTNPPYLTPEEINNNILKQDPMIALYGGIDGLYFYRLLAPYIKTNVRFTAFIEIDHNRKDDIFDIFNGYNFKNIIFYKDNYNLWRVMLIII